MDELLKTIWRTPAEIEAKGYRIHKVNDKFTVMWADNAAGEAIEYVGAEENLNKAVNLLITHITGVN